jgi:hypothetical protein
MDAAKALSQIESCGVFRLHASRFPARSPAWAWMFTAAGCRVIAMMTLKLTSPCLNMSIRDELFGNFKERAHVLTTCALQPSRVCGYIFPFTLQ